MTTLTRDIATIDMVRTYAVTRVTTHDGRSTWYTPTLILNGRATDYDNNIMHQTPQTAAKHLRAFAQSVEAMYADPTFAIVDSNLNQAWGGVAMWDFTHDTYIEAKDWGFATMPAQTLRSTRRSSFDARRRIVEG
jgi:hypothetical protein